MSEKHYLSAEDILGADDLKSQEVEVPEWGGVVRLRPMSGEEALKLVELSGTDRTGAALRVVALCAVKEDGSRLFTDEQIVALRAKSAAALLRLQKKAMELNSLVEEGQVEAKNA